MSHKTILVTAATGKVGKHLIPLLLQKQYTVHALVRSLDSPVSRRLEELGVKLFKGHFDDVDSIKAAAAGVDGVFVNAVPTFGSRKEADHVINIVNAAKDAGATAAVYLSGYIFDRKDEFPNYGPSHPAYWICENKAEAEATIKQAGFKQWTILRPVSFMDNLFTEPVKVQWPHLYTEHILLSTLLPTTQYPLVDTLTVAQYVEGAFAQPQIFHKQVIELASQPSTVYQIASELTDAIGIDISVKNVTKEEAASKGIYPMVIEWWEVMNKLDHKVNMKVLNKYPIKLRTFTDYLKRSKDTIVPLFAGETSHSPSTQ
ncbi:hypothetical protein Unana1_02323 [Umbelopsis nana]